MPTFVQRSFAGGEIAPAAYGRADLVKYQTGLRTCKNFLVRRHGGVSNRPGSMFISEQKSSAAAGRLIKFVFNAAQTYVLLFENLCMRVIKQGAVVVVSGVPAWSNATSYVVGDLASRLGINYYCIAAHINQQPPNATYWYAMPSNIYEIPTPYATADLSTLYTVQSGDIVTIVHPSYGPRNLSRTSDTTWILSLISFAPGQEKPTSVAVTGSAGSKTYTYHVTALDSETFEESEAAIKTQGSLTDPSTANPHTVSWVAAAGAQEYNIYVEVNGVPSFVGAAVGTTFTNDNIKPDSELTPPQARAPFTSANNYPSTVGYYQQRRAYANTNAYTEKVWLSKSGSFNNFGISSPLQDDDAVTFQIAGRQVNEIRHLMDIGNFILMTEGGEWVAEGDANLNGALTPTGIGLKQHSYYGSAKIPPVIIGNNLLYVQARQSLVRDLRFEFSTNGYAGNDLTVFAAHLFEGYTINYWDYAQIPHSIIWAVRSDGELVALTYLREHEIWGWHHHTTDGSYECVCVVPEGLEDAIYVLVKRTINGTTKRYVERFASRQITDVAVDAKFTDSFLSWDGRASVLAPSTTMTLSGGTTWQYQENLTLTASAGFFAAADVGNAIHLYLNEESLILTIQSYTSATVVTVWSNRTVPETFRNVAFSNWGKAVDDVSGLSHLEGKTVAILADGHVLTNGHDDPATVVAGGAIPTLPRPYVVIHVGLPIAFPDIELLDMEVIGQETLLDKKKIITSVTINVESSRGIWAGPDANHLYEYKQRTAGDLEAAIPLTTDQAEIIVQSSWSKTGRVLIRQRDPLPLTVLSAMPNGEMGG